MVSGCQEILYFVYFTNGSEVVMVLTGVSRLKGPEVRNGSERLSNELGSMGMGTPHEVLRYMGFGQKPLRAVLGSEENFSEICPLERHENFHFKL